MPAKSKTKHSLLTILLYPEKYQGSQMVFLVPQFVFMLFLLLETLGLYSVMAYLSNQIGAGLLAVLVIVFYMMLVQIPIYFGCEGKTDLVVGFALAMITAMIFANINTPGAYFGDRPGTKTETSIPKSTADFDQNEFFKIQGFEKPKS